MGFLVDVHVHTSKQTAIILDELWRCQSVASCFVQGEEFLIRSEFRKKIIKSSFAVEDVARLS